MKNVLIWDNSYDYLFLLKKLDEEGNGFLVIVDNNFTLLGMITDGDIRRAILNKKIEIWDIINKNPVTINTSVNRDGAIKILHKIKKRQIPVVDSSNKLVNIFYLEDEEKKFNNNYVVIMAGGLGTRLGELTKDIPKPMLNVAGKPMLENIILYFRDFGFSKFIFCVNYKSEIIIDYFQDGKRWEVEINYNFEQKKMGTAGALSLIEMKFEEHFFVVNGDVLTNINLQDFMNFHMSNQSNLTMCVKKIDYQIPYACIDIDTNNNITSLIEKPVQQYNINTGMYIVDPAALSLLCYNEYYDITTLIVDLISNNYKVLAYNHDEYWLDIGYKSDYQKANLDLTP
jgi:dTDP-glucose pyrophosphorylase